MKAVRGSKRERPAGSRRWELRVFVGRDPVTKRPKQVSRVFHGTSTQADTALARLITETAKGAYAGTDATVDDLLARYFEHLEVQGHSPTTLHGYRRYARVHISPAVGVTKVRKLTAWDLDQLYKGMIGAGRGAATVRQVHAVLSGALGQAVKWSWCATNVAKSASPPKIRAKRIVAPARGDVRRLIDLAEERDPVKAAAIYLAATTGARRGELCALRWSDVDLGAGRLRIERSIADLPGQVVEKSTKTHQERVISLGDIPTEALRRHRAGVEERARIGEASVVPGAFVFSERLDCATPIRPDRLTAFFTRLRDDLELPHVHLHSLRHAVATELAARGDVSVRTIAARLGHADASVTMKTYASFFPAADAEAADHLGRALKT